jgi:hypothetical protein
MRRNAGSLLLTLAALPAAPAIACECNVSSTFEQTFARGFELAEAVFLGVSGPRRAIELDLNCKDSHRLPAAEQLKCWMTTEVEFTVSQIWKGDVSQRMPVRTAPRDASCGTGLDEGREYIVFAYAIPNDGALYMDLCSPTRGEGGTDFEQLLAFLQRRASSRPNQSER